MIGQPYIEWLFVSNLDITVNYAEPVIDFSHTESPEVVIVETAKRTVRARYCIAADGARSFLRTKLEIGWEGMKPNMVWTVMDCWVETTFPVGKQIVTLEVDGESRVAWIPR
jgi:phenol 2-monooxygenase